MKLNPIDKEIKGTLFSKQFIGMWFIFWTACAIVASFMLSIEALFEARHENIPLPCDINALLTCSTVAASDQAEILGKIIPLPGGYTVPNAFLGMIFEAVFITIGVLMAFGGKKFKFPKWFSNAAFYGNVLALVFSYWLFYQSSFIIGALCPWCMLLMFSTTCQVFTHLAYSTLSDGLAMPLTTRIKFKAFIESKFLLLVNIAWVVAIIAFIVIKYGSRLITG